MQGGSQQGGQQQYNGQSSSGYPYWYGPQQGQQPQWGMQPGQYGNQNMNMFSQLAVPQYQPNPMNAQVLNGNSFATQASQQPAFGIQQVNQAAGLPQQQAPPDNSALFNPAPSAQAATSQPTAAPAGSPNANAASYQAYQQGTYAPDSTAINPTQGMTQAQMIKGGYI